MTEPVGRLVTWVSLLLKPRGAHRRTRPRPPPRPPLLNPAVIRSLPLPSHRSPYGLPTILDGTETAAVRPYLLTHAPYELQAAA
ncbi:hypothetical protein [Streptomyces violaceorubidus]|uniref:hypothetical protein n=1 Tax=Streptomyces violaceorubidus TaxID=284042 RepID=UPI000997963A|nr:hypothetical protein [Streptomyces violaceorubidus]